jgi:hypothetical protein
LPLAVWEALASAEELYVKINVAQHARTPASVLSKLAKDNNNKVRQAVAANPQVPYTEHDSLANDDSINVRWATLFNPVFQDWRFSRWLSEPELKTRAWLRLGKRDVFLRELIKIGDVKLRRKIADSGIELTQEALGLLVHDPDEKVRHALATRPRTYNIQYQLLRDSSVAVRRETARCLHPSLLNVAVTDADAEVRLAVVSHPNAWEFLLEQLARDADERVRKAALEKLDKIKSSAPR